MREFRLGVSEARDSEDIVEECLEQLGELAEESNLGFLYVTHVLAHHLPEILNRLRLRTRIAHWVGTAGLAICTTGREYYDGPATAVMAGRFPDGGFTLLPPLSGDLRGLDENHRAWIDAHPAPFGVLHGDPTTPVTAQALNALGKFMPDGFLVGGLTSSDEAHTQIADTIVDGGLSGVLFGPESAIVVSHTQGCVPLAGQHTVTRCERNVIAELDGRPALDVLREEAGEVIARNLERAAGYIFAGLPVPRSDVGDYLVRNIIGFDTRDKRVAIGEWVEEGDPFMFCRRDGNSARADLVRMLDDVSHRLEGRQPRGALYFSCLARGRHQFGPDSAELRMIGDRLGDLPLAGFFANGEIYHGRLYGYTGVLAVFV